MTFVRYFLYSILGEFLSPERMKNETRTRIKRDERVLMVMDMETEEEEEEERNP